MQPGNPRTGSVVALEDALQEFATSQAETAGPPLRPARRLVSDGAAVYALQAGWAARSITDRLHILRRARSLLAQASAQLADAMPANLDRTRADSLASEVLPLLAACRFLEREAPAILRTRRLGRRGLPFWLAGVDSEVQRVPFGTVLVIAPANYPLFLAGAQTLQALAAGNAVVWKPGRGGRPVALLFAATLAAAGLPAGLLRITEDTISAAAAEVDLRPDKIVFTGSSAAGREVLRRAAQTVTPVVAELSGCDAAIVLPSADPQLVVAALTFAMRLNGSATCMAPRRLILVGGEVDGKADGETGSSAPAGAGHAAWLATLAQRFAAMPATPLSLTTFSHLRDLLSAAERKGATILGSPEVSVGEPSTYTTRPLLVLNAAPTSEVAQADIFAPVLTVLHAAEIADVPALDRACPFGLTASIFGDETTARVLANSLNVGTVVINDLIVPTADPRVPFTGRRGSGFGATRGAEGLLEMTAPKVISARRNNNRRHLAPTTRSHEALLTAAIAMQHAPTLRQRVAGAHAMLKAITRMSKT